MDVCHESNVYDFEARRKIEAGRRARTAPVAPAGEKPVIAAAWYHGDAIEADRSSGEVRSETYNVIPLRH